MGEKSEFTAGGRLGGFSYFHFIDELNDLLKRTFLELKPALEVESNDTHPVALASKSGFETLEHGK